MTPPPVAGAAEVVVLADPVPVEHPDEELVLVVLAGVVAGVVVVDREAELLVEQLRAPKNVVGARDMLSIGSHNSTYFWGPENGSWGSESRGGLSTGFSVDLTVFVRSHLGFGHIVVSKKRHR